MTRNLPASYPDRLQIKTRLPLTLVVVAYGLLCAMAYCCLLPLWEGFDEGYHYGYVQYLSSFQRLPVLGSTNLSQQVWHSYQRVAVSHYLQPYAGAPLNFTTYFAMPQKDRQALRRQAEAIPVEERLWPQADKPNYEVHQPLLPYLYMAAIDWLLQDASIFTRVLAIRLACALLSILMLAHAMHLLARQLSLPDPCTGIALFCTFSSQMLYATICHVCNDWLAVPIAAYLIFACIRRGPLLLGCVFAAAILTKAYFLFLAPLALFAIWRRRHALLFFLPLLLLAAPWYARNLLLYRNLSAVVQTAGATPAGLLHSALTLPWVESIRAMALGSLWTGNNSFTTFSIRTLCLLLALIAVGLTMFTVSSRITAVAGRTVAAATALFCAAMAFITVSFHLSSKGAVWFADAKYAQPLLGPVLLLVFAGYSSFPRWGRPLSAALATLWGYVLAATFIAKLIPLYGGFVEQRPHLSGLAQWYLEQGTVRDDILRTLCMTGPEVIWGLVLSALLLELTLLSWIAMQLLHSSWKGIDHANQP